MNSTFKIISRTSRAYKSVLKRQCSRTYATKSIFKEDSFKDQVVVVTGGSKGIGKAISDNFANLGANVVVLSRDNEAIKNTVDSLSKQYSTQRHLGLQCDVSQVQQVNSAMEAIEKQYGAVDILINNAGVSKDALLLRLKDEDLTNQININLMGPILMARAVVKKMLTRHKGSIINIGSVVGVSGGRSGQVAYSAAKAGLIGMTKTLASELGSRNIRVNLVAPGFIDTDMIKATNIDPKQIALGRIGTTDDVVNAVNFIASNEYLTGQVIVVDGGLSLLK
jgi:NAD(P)-dependent dehydrogenase (short-subunit alcohol dehydrogenase family)